MAAKKASSSKVATVPSVQSRTRKAVHAAATILEEAFDEKAHDLGPWMETPRSTRVSAFRYDFLNRALQVTWRNRSNHGYIYLDVPYERYKSMARAASKGRFVNNALGPPYRVMTPDEVQAPSNSSRSGLTSRVR